MVRVGIVGCNYGRTVLFPAFSADRRCSVVAFAARDKARAEQAAHDTGVARGYGNWADLVDDPQIDVVAIATPPRYQPEIAIRALRLGKPVFAEKTMAADLDAARTMREEANAARRPTMVDFEFPELPTWRRAKTLLDDGAIGPLRHVVVTWNVENAATRLHLRNWKTVGSEGGGVLGNFLSHCMHYVEYFAGPLSNLSARVSGLPADTSGLETTVMLNGTFESGAPLSLAMSCASYLGSGHRIEFYGNDGTLMLVNTDADYMRGFELWHARRPAERLSKIEIVNPADKPDQDGRIAPVAALVTRFIDAVKQEAVCIPSFASGYRAQYLLDAVRRSHQSGRSVDTPADGRSEAAA